MDVVRRRGRPRQEFCYMNHARTPDNVDKAGGCKTCKRENRGKKNPQHVKKIRKTVSTYRIRANARS